MQLRDRVKARIAPDVTTDGLIPLRPRPPQPPTRELTEINQCKERLTKLEATSANLMKTLDIVNSTVAKIETQMTTFMQSLMRALPPPPPIPLHLQAHQR